MSNSLDEWHLVEKELSRYSNATIELEFTKRQQSMAARDFDLMELSIEEKAHLYKVVQNARLDYERYNNWRTSMQWEKISRVDFYNNLKPSEW